MPHLRHECLNPWNGSQGRQAKAGRGPWVVGERPTFPGPTDSLRHGWKRKTEDGGPQKLSLSLGSERKGPRTIDLSRWHFGCWKQSITRTP
jgi:hypothetical protein